MDEPVLRQQQLDTTYLAPDNHFQRVIAEATFRELPLRSMLAMRYTWSETKSRR